MTAAEYEQLSRTQAIIARMPRDVSSTPAAMLLLAAVEAPRDEALNILLKGDLRQTAATLKYAALVLRSTGHFADAEWVDLFGATLMDWDRRGLGGSPRSKFGRA